MELLLDVSRCESVLVLSPTSPEARPWVTSEMDASGDVGCAIVFRPVVVQAWWSPETLPLSSGAKELYALALLLAIVGYVLGDVPFRAHTDNMPNVLAILKGRMGDKDARPWLAALREARRPTMCSCCRAGCRSWLRRFVSFSRFEYGALRIVACYRGTLTRVIVLRGHARSPRSGERSRRQWGPTVGR